MNDITYGTFSETYSIGDTTRISYGIAVYAHAECDGTATVILSVRDVSADKEKIDELVSLCNRLQLDPEHLFDVIDDFLASCNKVKKQTF